MKVIVLMHLELRNDLLAYSAASFAEYKSSISTCGFIIILLEDMISWRANKQNYVKLSNLEVEHAAISQACQDIIAINRLFP